MKIKLILTSLVLAALMVFAGYAMSGNSASAALVEDTELPLTDSAVDRVLLVHGLEMADDAHV